MLSKKELLDLRKNGEIIKSSELINYYIENKKLIDEKYYDLVFNLLVEYFLNNFRVKKAINHTRLIAFFYLIEIILAKSSNIFPFSSLSSYK
jgi:hypothetical protein